MNQQHLSFSNLGQSLVQDNRNAQDYLTLQLLNNYKSPQAFSSALTQQDRLIRQVEKQNQLIKQLYSKMSVADVQTTDNRSSLHNKSGHLSPYQVQQPLMQYMPPLPPPPVFFPQNFSFLQKQEMERQQQERLRMLLLMKKLREENLELKMKLLAKGDQPDNSYQQQSQSSVQESSKSSQQYKQQRRPNGPTAKDIEKEQAALQQMINKRAQMQLKIRCKRLLMMLAFIRKIKQSIDQKAMEFSNKFPETILKFQEEIFKWMLSITGQVTLKLKSAKGIFLYIEPKTNPNEQKKRMDLLKTYTRNYIDVIFDNKQTFPTFCKDFLLKFTHNYYVTPPNFLLKFELSRLTFTKYGGTLMDKRKAQMMLMTMILLRMYIQFISEIWEPIPAHAKAAEQKVNQQFLLNLQAICSSIHIIIIELLRGLVAVQPDNMKQIPVEFQPKAKSGGVVRVKNFNERDVDKPKLESLKDSDEPLVYPLLDKAELQPFFVDNASVEMIKSVLEGWSEEMYEVIEQYRKEIILERKKQFEENEKKVLMNQIQKMKEVSGNVLLLRQQNNMIAEQREKLKQMKHFFNLPTKTNRNTSFEPSEQNQSSRRSKYHEP